MPALFTYAIIYLKGQILKLRHKVEVQNARGNCMSIPKGRRTRVSPSVVIFVVYFEQSKFYAEKTIYKQVSR